MCKVLLLHQERWWILLFSILNRNNFEIFSKKYFEINTVFFDKYIKKVLSYCYCYMIFIVILVGLHLEICKIHKTLLPPFLSNYFIAPGTSELPVPLYLIPFIEVTKFVSVLLPLDELWKNTTVCPGDNRLTVISAPDYLILFKKIFITAVLICFII